MTTITKLEQQFKDGKPSGYKVNLSDGSWGYLVEKDSDKGLKDGDEVNFTAETPNGKSYKKLTIHKASGTASQNNNPIPPQPAKPQIHVGTGKSKEELKADAAIKSAEYILNAFIAEKLDWPQIQEKQEYLFKLLSSEIDEIFASK